MKVFDVGGVFWLKCCMASCNKCGQCALHLDDSWCLACAATEALNKELAQPWGLAGSRAVATDIVVSGLRQVRALRRFGLAVAVATRATGSEGAALERASQRSARAASSPKEEEEKGSKVKVEPPEEEEEESGSSSSESDEEDKKKEELPGIAAKSKATSPLKAPVSKKSDEASSSKKDRERSSRRSSSAGRVRLEERRPKEGKKHKFEDSPRGSKEKREHREKKEKRREKGESERKRFRPGHRGGSRHQRQYRALEDPHRRLHQQRPGDYWDQDHFARGLDRWRHR